MSFITHLQSNDEGLETSRAIIPKGYISENIISHPGGPDLLPSRCHDKPVLVPPTAHLDVSGSPSR